MNELIKYLLYETENLQETATHIYIYVKVALGVVFISFLSFLIHSLIYDKKMFPRILFVYFLTIFLFYNEYMNENQHINNFVLELESNDDKGLIKKIEKNIESYHIVMVEIIQEENLRLSEVEKEFKNNLDERVDKEKVWNEIEKKLRKIIRE